MVRLIALSLLTLAAPLRAEPAVPQPVVLDWSGQFRLNAAPNNVAEVTAAPATADAHSRRPAEASSRAVAALGPSDPAMTRWTNRPIAPEATSLNVEAPIQTGPVSVGASYGKYRAMPTTREISAHDMRVSLGVAF
ncbi:hypothetical protein [Rhizorhabdus dicambivorans]|nr:hypothetical protein [Rhizorhabdus dicambivorans]ATE64292.1 hypothetical protein CMV14_07690 [Rhizorhabdus dicambivorans]